MAWRRRADRPDGDEARLWLFGVARRVLLDRKLITLLQALQWTGSFLGLAILTTAFAHGSGASGRPGAEQVHPSTAALVDGITTAFRVSRVFAVLVLLIACFGLRSPARPTV